MFTTTLKHLKSIRPILLLPLIPLFFIFTQNSSRPHLINSLLTLYAGILIIHLCLIKKIFPQNKQGFYLATLIFLFTVSSLLHPNPLESIFADRAGLLPSLLFLYYTSQSGEKIPKNSLLVYVLAIITLSTLYVITSLIHPKFNQLPVINVASPAELVTLLVLSLISLNYLLGTSKKTIILGFVLLIATGTFLIGSKTEPSNIHSISKTYSSLVESLRNPKDFLLGVSPGRFQDFITKHIPTNTQIYKTTSQIPTYSQSRLLEQISTTGTIFVALLLYGLWKEYQSISIDIDVDHNTHQLSKFTITSFFIVILFVPVTTVTVFFFTLLYAYIKQHQKITKDISIDHKNLLIVKSTNIISPLVKAVSISLSLFVCFMSFKSITGEVYFAKYQRWANNDQYLLAYNSLQKAINFYPFRADYRSQYSITNLVLATKLADENGLGNEQDRANITELYQQSIREALAATKLEPNSSVNWHNLGIIYRELIGFAENSLTYAEGAYFNAIKLSPKNPMLWIDLGYTYYKAEKYADSCNANKNAITIKPDWYLPYLNSALCSQRLNQPELAKEYLDKALSLTDVNTQEYQEVTSALKSTN